MPVHPQRSQSQYFRRQTDGDQLLNRERRKRHGHAIYPTRSAGNSKQPGARIDTLFQNGGCHTLPEHQPSHSHDNQTMTCLPDVKSSISNDFSTRAGCSVYPYPAAPPSPPVLTYYGRSAVVRQRLERTPSERDTLKKQQRRQIYALNKVMTQLEIDRFNRFCERNGFGS